MRKGEIACFKQFLLFSRFRQLYIFVRQNAALCGNNQVNTNQKVSEKSKLKAFARPHNKYTSDENIPFRSDKNH